MHVVVLTTFKRQYCRYFPSYAMAKLYSTQTHHEQRVARYTYVAMALHWLIASAIAVMLATGFWMVDAIKVPETQATAFHTYQFHKSLGLTILVLSLCRLGWRLLHPPPALPSEMGSLSRFAAHSTHIVFYALMISMPISGWAMVSASPIGMPTVVFDWFEVPHIPWLENVADKAAAEAQLKQMHLAAALTMSGLLCLHIAAALKHQFIDRDDLIMRIVPRWSASNTAKDKS